MNIRTSMALLLAGLALLATSRTGFGQDSQPTADSLANSSSRVIRVNDAQVVCLHKVSIAAQGDGLIQELLVDEGSTVKKDDTLLVIDNRVAAAELKVAQKELEAAKKQAEQTADVEYAEKAYEVSDAEYKDIYELYQKNSGNYNEARRKHLEKERARLGIDVAKIKHEQEILAADVAAEKVRAAQVQLDLFKVAAPYDGVIYKRLRDRGEWVRAGEPVLKLAHMNEMKVDVLVPVEKFSVAELRNAPMKVTIPISPHQVVTYEPKVEFVSPEYESRLVRIATRIQNEMVEGHWLLSDGMTASIEITLPQ